MATLKIVATLVPAQKQDLFNDGGELRESATVFVKSSTGRWGGPHYLEYHFLDEIVTLMHQDFYYVIKQPAAPVHPIEFTFKLILRPAVGDDFKWRESFPRWDRVYYLLIDNDTIQGPLYLFPNSRQDIFKEQYKNKQIYVPNELQSFEPYRPKQASS
jgi:hypothetical protein